MLDFIGLSLGFLLTILVFSYLLGDNPFFRLAIHIFIGVAAAYVAIVTINNVLIPRLFIPLFTGTRGERLSSILLFIPSLFLFLKVTPFTTSRWDQAINGFIIVLGTVTTLIYFHYSTQDTPGQNEKRLPIIEQISNIGKVFLAITFGALYAGVFMSALAALVERVASFWDFLNTIGFQLFSSF